MVRNNKNNNLKGANIFEKLNSARDRILILMGWIS